MTHRRYERMFMRVCERFQLNPSNWIPHFRPLGLYEMGYTLTRDTKIEDQEADTPIPVFSIYSMFETICRERAIKRLGLDNKEWVHAKLGFWYELWGFLSEVDMGIYDTTNWIELPAPPGRV